MSWPTSGASGCALATAFRNVYIDDVQPLDINGIEDCMRACRHPLVDGNQHQVLVDNDPVVVGAIEGVYSFFLVAVNSAEDLAHFLFPGDWSPGLIAAEEAGLEQSQIGLQQPAKHCILINSAFC